MTPTLEREYLAFVNNLGVERSKVTGGTDPHTDQMSFILLHMVTGMCTEVGEVTEVLRGYINGSNELDVTKLKDELGDLFFYLCGAAIDLGLTIREIVDVEGSKYLNGFITNCNPNCTLPGEFIKPQLVFGVMGLVVETSKILDLLKKHMAYNRDLDPNKIQIGLGKTMIYMGSICHDICVNLDEIIAMNMAKLRKRYPNGYTHTNANNRDRQAEDEAQQRVTNVDGERVVKGSEKDDRWGQNAFTK